jgi:hypothetical protein
LMMLLPALVTMFTLTYMASGVELYWGVHD